MKTFKCGVGIIISIVGLGGAAIGQTTNPPGVYDLTGPAASGLFPLTVNGSGTLQTPANFWSANTPANGRNDVDEHFLYVSPGGTNIFAVRGDPMQPSGLFWSLTGGAPKGVCAQATNGDTIVVLPGNYLATQIPLNAGVKMIGVGNPFIKRTNYFISGTNADYHAARSMIYVNDNTLIDGITFQCGTNQYDSVVGPNIINQGDYLQDPIQSTNIQTGDAVALHSLFIWPEYGFTNFQTMATNCIFRNCLLKGATDVLYGTGNRSIDLVFSNAVYGPGASYEALVTSNFPASDIQFQNCRLLSQWDWLRCKGDGGLGAIKYRTSSCWAYTSSDISVAVGGAGQDGSARSVFMVGDGTWIDNGSTFYLANGTRINCAIQAFTGNAFLNGTVFFLTNSIIATDNDIGRAIHGTFYNGTNNSGLTLAPVRLISFGTNVAGLNPDFSCTIEYLTTNNVVQFQAPKNVDSYSYRAHVVWVTNSAAADKAIIGPANVNTNIGGTVSRVTNLTEVIFTMWPGKWTNMECKPKF